MPCEFVSQRNNNAQRRQSNKGRLCRPHPICGCAVEMACQGDPIYGSVYGYTDPYTGIRIRIRIYGSVYGYTDPYTDPYLTLPSKWPVKVQRGSS